MTNTEHAALARVDVAFAIDTTGSMGTFLEAAKRNLKRVLERLAARPRVDLQVGLVEYRDFPPQDLSFVTRVYPLTQDLSAVKSTIDTFVATGGGDGPEAVYSGVVDACRELAWRPRSLRLIVLVGDAPPHAFVSFDGQHRNTGDGFPRGCPSGLDVRSTTAEVEALGATLHAITMNTWGATVQAFTELARGTGGVCVESSASDVIAAIEALLERELGQVATDARVLERARDAGSLSARQLADALALPRPAVAASIARLGRRGFFDALSR